VHLVPTWMLKGHGGMLALDLGGTNFRAGVVTFGKRSLALAEARVVKVARWRHGEKKVSRDAALKHLVRMMKGQIRWARDHDIDIVPLIGIACPGIIEEDGSIKRGGQNLPGNWESKNFNLPSVLRAKIPKIGKEETLVVMHNDAVVQGLSELPRYRDRQSWAALTIGTGLGNARYTTRKANGG
jgi:predicted NBD/HSP70 family sugar kinase